jgi:hypothetical protein
MAALSDTDWIAAMDDEECIEVFRLYAESADELLDRHGSACIAAAVRYALRHVAGTDARPEPAAQEP